MSALPERCSLPAALRPLSAKAIIARGQEASEVKQIKISESGDLAMIQVKVKCGAEPAACGVWMGTSPFLGAHAIVSARTALAGKGPFSARSIAPVPDLGGGSGTFPLTASKPRKNIPDCCSMKSQSCLL